jgi:hypothetical protein
MEVVVIYLFCFCADLKVSVFRFQCPWSLTVEPPKAEFAKTLVKTEI